MTWWYPETFESKRKADLIIFIHFRFDKEEFGEQYDQAELEKSKEVMESKALPPVFAVPLSKSSPDGEYPQGIKLLMEYLTNKCLRTESIFRRSPNILHVKEIRSAMNKRKPAVKIAYSCF